MHVMIMLIFLSICGMAWGWVGLAGGLVALIYLVYVNS